MTLSKKVIGVLCIILTAFVVSACTVGGHLAGYEPVFTEEEHDGGDGGGHGHH